MKKFLIIFIPILAVFAIITSLNVVNIKMLDEKDDCTTLYKGGILVYDDCEDYLGADITSILSTDTLKDSRTTINDNFTNLNNALTALEAYNHSNYDTAYSWGNHADAGYLALSVYLATTSHALISSLPSLSITESQISDLGSYLTAETDPIWTAASSSYLTTASAGSTYLPLAGGTLTNNLLLKKTSGTASPHLYLYESGGMSSLSLQYTDADGGTIMSNQGLNFYSAGNVKINANNDNDDYFLLTVNSNIPTIRAYGANMKITADGGTIDFDNENLTTTGYASSTTFCLTGDTCITEWPSLSGSLDLNGLSDVSLSGTSTGHILVLQADGTWGNVATSTLGLASPGNNISIFVNDAGYLTTVDISANTNLSITATGLELSGDAIVLTSGYNIPLTASTTQWNTAYNWGNHALGGYLTSVASDSDWTGHNNYPSACSAGQYISAIGDTLTCGTPTDTNTTYTVSATGLELSGTAIALTSGYNIPLTASTTQWNTAYNITQEPKEKCFTLATSSFAVYEDSIIWSPEAAITVSKQRCRVVGGTSVAMNISDGTNDMDSITCATSLTEDASLSNNTWSADEQMTVEFGTVTGGVSTVNYCIVYTYN
jgi:hypothetical protein